MTDDIDWGRTQRDTYNTKYGWLTVTIEYKHSSRPASIKLRFSPKTITAKIKQFLGLDYKQELELTRTEMDEFEESFNFWGDWTESEKILAFLGEKARRQYGRNSAIQKAIWQVQEQKGALHSDLHVYRRVSRTL